MQSDVARDTPAPAQLSSTAPATPAQAERRQLTVMFFNLVGSTELSTRLDPEDLQEVIRAYRDSCAKAIAQYNGYIAAAFNVPASQG